MIVNTKLLIIVGITTILAGSLTVFVFSQQSEIECLRLYKNINEISRTPEMSLAEREDIEQHKSWIFEYVEKDCPDFSDLEFIYNNYKQNISEPEDIVEEGWIDRSK